jgi:hypothetical protein
MATLTPSSNQKDFAASEWNRRAAATAVIRVSRISSNGDEVPWGEGAMKDSALFWSEAPLSVASTIFTMEIHGIAKRGCPSEAEG